MITRIDKLKNVGVFHDFSWDGLDNFRKKNLIYGWNYSGKTTLSKLFQCLEHKNINRLFPGSEFNITIQNQGNSSTSFSHTDIEGFPYEVKVFNTQYIKDVFVSDDMDLDIQPISFYLGDSSGKLDARIKEIEREKYRLENIRDNRYQKIIDDFNRYGKQNGEFSEKAKDIRENYLDNKIDQNRINKAVIQQITDTIKNNLSVHILPDVERDKTKEEAVADKDFDLQKADFNFHENLEELKEDIMSILEDTAIKAMQYPELDKNKELFDWVQTGIKLHENDKECKFCSSPIPENRISDLNSYYSKKLQEIQSAIGKTRTKIKEERENLKLSFPDKRNLGISFRKDYETAVENLNKKVNKYLEQLTALEDDLKRKESNIFNSIDMSDIRIVTLSENFDDINNSMESHNNWLDDFESNKEKAIDKIIYHYVAEYLQEENYNKKKSDQNRALRIIVDINSRIKSNDTEKLELESKLKGTVKGKEELNSILEILLHRNDIKIEIQNEKFTLERSGYPANNLSEGEKSAIAFSYFLTELKSLGNDNPPKLPNTIVFIDDPVSSLDSNHIFQVRQLLYRFFGEQDFAQLFISTHNFEFFSVMLDTRIFGRITKDTGENKRPLYFIKRCDDGESIIKKLPNSFSLYKSEYVGLFHTIKEFNDLENKEDFTNLLLLPNAVRRFLELYTLMKYPSDTEIDARVKIVFNPEDKPTYNTKLLHWFSHQNQFEKVQTHDDKLLQIEGIISELLDHIETKDETHWKGLIGE